MNFKKLQKIVLLVLLFVMAGVVSVNAAVGTISDVTFDSDYYYSNYGDLREHVGSDANALRDHFAYYGISEGRIASPAFDIKYYIDNNEDLKNAYAPDGVYNFEEAYNHFILFGMKEGRIASPLFDVRAYLAEYEDLRNEFGEENYEAAYNHFIEFGINEGRISSENFDVAHYVANYPDLQEAFGTNYMAAYNHYLTYGVNEGRTFSHIYGEATVSKEATCTEPGVKVAKCIACDAVKTEEIPVIDHDIVDDEENSTEPTCTEPGVKVVKCTRCDFTETEEIPMLDHNPDMNEENFLPIEGEEPTCVESGKVVTECLRCHEPMTIDVAPLGHDYDTENPIVTTEPTCEEEGINTIECKREGCTAETEGHAYTTTVPSLGGHNMKKIDAFCTESTCEVAGEEYKVCTNPGCTHTETTELPLAAHEAEEEGVITQDDPCQEGVKEFHCKNCGAVIEEKTETVPAVHNGANTPAGEGTVIAGATCKTAGKEEVVCDDCGETFEREIPKAAHDYRTYKTEDATCGKGSTTYKICINCNATTSVTADDALQHNVVIDAAVAATCTTTGLTEGSHCSECKSILTKQEEIKALGHNMVADPDNSTEATCTTDGVKAEKCDRVGCTHTTTETITALGHDFDKTIEENVTPAECGVAGSVKCSRCDETEEIPALEHNMVADPDNSTEATCTTDGVKAEKCDREGCTHTTTETITALGHDFDKTIEENVTPAECGVAGSVKCSRCDETEEIPALEHNMVVDPDNSTEATCTTDGVEVKKCSREGCTHTTTETITALGHDFDKTIEENVTPAECGVAGSVKCSRCDETEEIPALVHSWGEWITITEATEEADGEEARKCSVCGEIEKRAVKYVAPEEQPATPPTEE